ncbi:MAG TPA: hypothetical protein VKU41_30860 [Polyangiaceae bacterium]|nr:hypothetical protein [Polyangiaceae bacterium]
MTTWIQIMAHVRRLDEQRREKGRIDDGDAQALVTMLLEFHRHAVQISPSGEMPAVVAEKGKGA